MASKIKAPTIDELTAYPKRPEDLQAPVLNINPPKPEAQAPALDIDPEPTEQKAPEYPTVTSMAELVEKLNPYQPPTPEQLEAEKKRERSKSTISAISDGLSALANIYATSKGAAPQQLSSLSVANAQRRKAMLDKRQQLIDAKLRQTVQAKQQDDANALHKYSAEAAAYNTNRAFETSQANRKEDVAYRNAQAIEAQERWKKEFGIKQQNADTQEARVKNYRDNLKRLSDAQVIKIQENEEKTLAKLVGKSVSFTHKDAKTGKDIRLDVPEKAITSSRAQLTELLINNPAYMPSLTGRMRSKHLAELNQLSEAKFVDVVKANAAKYPDMIRQLEQTKSLYLDEVYKIVQENTASQMAELEELDLGFEPDEQGNELPQTSEVW